MALEARKGPLYILFMVFSELLLSLLQFRLTKKKVRNLELCQRDYRCQRQITE